jgi:hypothetical protein
MKLNKILGGFLIFLPAVAMLVYGGYKFGWEVPVTICAIPAALLCIYIGYYIWNNDNA